MKKYEYKVCNLKTYTTTALDIEMYCNSYAKTGFRLIKVIHNEADVILYFEREVGEQ